MTVGQKASLSLLCAVLVFAALAVAAFSGLFNVVESRFYNPSITRSYEKSVESLAEASDLYHGLNLGRFGAALGQDAVKRSFLPNMSAEDVFNRVNILGKLQEETPGLTGLRLIDSSGKRIHFSTIPGDILRQSPVETLYRNYGDPGDPPYEAVSAPEKSPGRIGLDGASGRFVYSLPFSDSFGVYRGTAVFFVSVDGLLSYCIKAGLLSVGDEAVFAGDRGILLGVPGAGRETLREHVAGLWSSTPPSGPLTVTAGGSSDSLVLFSRSTARAGFLGVLASSSSFVFPAAMRWLLLASFFVTAYLLTFLLLNLRQDRMAVLSDRIKRFQITLLEEYLDNKADIDFARWSRELEARRGEVRTEIKKSVGKVAKGREGEVDELIDKSWDEILDILGKKAESEALPSNVSVKEVERLIGEALRRGNFVLPPAALSAPARAVAPSPAAPAPAEEVEEAEAAEEAESVEEAEPVEEAEAIEEAEPIAEAEAVAEAEPIAEAEAVAEAEPVEEAEAIEEAEPIAEAEAVAEAEPIAEAEAVAEAEPIAEAEAVAEAEPIAEAEAVAEAEPIAEAEAEPVEEAEVVAEAEPIEELTPIEEEPPQREPAIGDLREAAAKALALATDDDDVPLIPESSGLELADEADVSDIIGFIEVEEASRALDLSTPIEEDFGEEVDLAEFLGDEEGPGTLEELPASEGAAEGEPPEAAPSEEVEEAEIALSLGDYDLSPLEEWAEGPAGAAEIDATREGGMVPEIFTEAPEDELDDVVIERVATPSESPFAANEADDSAVSNGEISMLSDEVRESLEYLPGAEAPASDAEASELVECVGSFWSYVPPERLSASRSSSPVVDELPVVDEPPDSPGAEAAEVEYLGDASGEEGEAFEEGPVVYEDGLFRLDSAYSGPFLPLDDELRDLVDSVLAPTAPRAP